MKDQAAIERGIVIVSGWYDDQSGGQSGRIGIATTGLVLIDLFAREFPLTENSILTRGGSQVKGLSGSAGNKIIKRFEPGLARLGTESGRTSRGTPQAARILASRLNEEPLFAELDAEQRAAVSEAVLSWLVENPIRDIMNRDELRFEYHANAKTTSLISSLIMSAQQRPNFGAVLQHLVGAKLALRFPDLTIENHSHTTADSVTRRTGDFCVHDSVFHVTAAPAQLLIEKCRQNLNEGLHPIILVPRDKRIYAEALAVEVEQIAVTSIEEFVAQNLDEISEFDRQTRPSRFRALLEIYNNRVSEVESDLSIRIQLPTGI